MHSFLISGSRENYGKARLRQTQRDRIAEIFPGKPQAQAFDAVSHGRLDRDFAITHASGDVFRPGPEGRIQSTLAGQCIDHAALSGFRQQAQRAVEVGFTAAVGAGDQVQPAQRNHQFIDRAVIGHREGFEHGKLPAAWFASSALLSACSVTAVGLRAARASRTAMHQDHRMPIYDCCAVERGKPARHSECSKPVHPWNPVLSSQSYRHWHVRTTQRSLHGWVPD